MEVSVQRVLAACLALALAAPARAQAPVVKDADVLQGIRQVEDGDYDAAILTLDNAARRLSADPTRARELSQAYLYLGVAYVGKGHEAAAKAKFREAVMQLRDLTLSPEKFPPKVIDLFEAAREEVAHSPAAAPPAAAAPATAAAPKKGHGKTLLIGAGVAAAAGVAIAAGGGGDSGGTTVDVFNGNLSGGQPTAERFFGPSEAAGQWQLSITWANPDSEVECEVFTVPAGEYVTPAERRGQTLAEMSWAGPANASFKLFMHYDAENHPAPGAFELRVTRPR
jgi:tetratricopeptide (TPR) repeat protein